jgi:hypothetical protein
MLLGAERREDGLERAPHGRREDGRIAGRLVVIGREPDRVEERVDLEFSLDDLVVRRISVGVRVEQNIARFTLDDAAQRMRDALVVPGQADVRPYGRAGVAQPLGRDIAGRHVRRSVAFGDDVPVDRLVVRGREERIEFGTQRRWKAGLGRAGRRVQGRSDQQHTERAPNDRANHQRRSRARVFGIP